MTSPITHSVHQQFAYNQMISSLVGYHEHTHGEGR
jgi:hypothetical protein